MIEIREIKYNPPKPNNYDYYGFRTKDNITKYLVECPFCKFEKITKKESCKCTYCGTSINIKDHQKPKTFWCAVFLKFPSQFNVVPTGVYYIKNHNVNWWVRHYKEDGDTHIVTLKENGYYNWYIVKNRITN